LNASGFPGLHAQTPRPGLARKENTNALRKLALTIDREPVVTGGRKRDLASSSAQRSMSWAKRLHPMMLRADSM